MDDQPSKHKPDDLNELDIDSISKPSSHLDSQKADKETKKGLADQTGLSADGRVLYINLIFFRYGTDDKAHAAALVFCFLLLFLIAIIIIYGARCTNSTWFDKVFSGILNAFLFISGIALGTRGSHKSKKSNDIEE